MLLYHFGSRAGLVSAIVESVESAQRALLAELAPDATGPHDLAMKLWRQVSAPEMLPFVRLFFECVAATGGAGLQTRPKRWVRRPIPTSFDSGSRSPGGC